jgi:hypothetical protein
MRPRFVLVVLVTAVSIACSEPPEKERLQAETALVEARRAGAERYAIDQLRASEALLKKYEAAVDARDYRLALSSALEARETAYEASKAAIAAKTRDYSTAQGLVVQVGALIRAATARLAPGATPRLSTLASERLRAEVKVASTSLQEARTAMEREDYAAVSASLGPLVEQLTKEMAPGVSAPAGRGR